MHKRHDIPPLAAVRVFEAVARHMSFTRAAEELGMTQAAASYQVKVLEGRLGQPLFIRHAKRIELTETGRRLAPGVTEAFNGLAATFAEAGQEASGTLNIKSQATFAAQWLMQRIGTFQRANPKLTVRLNATMEASNFEREDIDIAIRAGSGEWAGLVSHMLLESIFTPMLSPKLAEAIGGIETPRDILRYPIFDPDDPWWKIWFELAGVAGTPVPPRREDCFGTQFLEGRAVLAGQCVGMLNPLLFREELASGQLLRPFELVGRGDIVGYFLVYPESRRNAPKIRLFREWILGEAGVLSQPPASLAS